MKTEPQVRWFDRKFEFSFPPSVHPVLRDRLRSAPDRLESLVHGVPREAMLNKPDGAWSIQENIGHLLDLEPLWAARLDAFLAGSDRLTPADLSNRATHEANHNAADLGALLIAFREARRAFIERLDVLAPQDFERVARHPRLDQEMRLVDHLFFVAEHDEHHLSRIEALRRRLQ